MKVLLSRQGGLFVCGTNAFNPLCANYTVSTYRTHTLSVKLKQQSLLLGEAERISTCQQSSHASSLMIGASLINGLFLFSGIWSSLTNMIKHVAFSQIYNLFSVICFVPKAETERG